MSSISLSGLAAAKVDLNTTSNNLANANTFGFKESRAEFGDIYSHSLFTNGKTATGGGAQVSKVAQQFHEGTSIYTNNPLDLRVSGSGFFSVSKDEGLSGNNALTRNGAFHMDKQNKLVNSDDEYLMGYAIDEKTGEVTSYEPKSIEIPQEFGIPKQSSKISMELNLPANIDAKDVNNFDFNDPDTFHKSTSTTVHDSIGKSYKMTTYYVKGQTPQNTWNVFYTMTDKGGEKPLNISNGNVSVTPPGQSFTHQGHTISFNSNGTLKEDGINGGALPLDSVSFADAGLSLEGADGTQQVEMEFDSITQFASPFEIHKFSDDGATTGYLSKVTFNAKGDLVASYSNGVDRSLARVALTKVANEGGLDKIGGTKWRSSGDSGEIVWGEAGQGSFGSIKSGVLEQSNIDMTQELVDLITAQRNFQANSRALEVDNGLMQNIIQIR